MEKEQALNPTMVCMLYAESFVVKERLQTNNEGRKPGSAFEIGVHRSLQATVATMYGISVGVPIYLLNSSQPLINVVSETAKRLQARNSQTIYKLISA